MKQNHAISNFKAIRRRKALQFEGKKNTQKTQQTVMEAAERIFKAFNGVKKGKSTFLAR